jgi:hypothetical protein
VEDDPGGDAEQLPAVPLGMGPAVAVGTAQALVDAERLRASADYIHTAFTAS